MDPHVGPGLLDCAVISGVAVLLLVIAAGQWVIRLLGLERPPDPAWVQQMHPPVVCSKCRRGYGTRQSDDRCPACGTRTVLAATFRCDGPHKRIHGGHSESVPAEGAPDGLACPDPDCTRYGQPMARERRPVHSSWVPAHLRQHYTVLERPRTPR